MRQPFIDLGKLWGRRPRLQRVSRPAILLLAASTLLAADDSLAVRPDLSGMVDRYLTQIAERMWTERDAKIAALHNAGDVHGRQQYIRETILKEIGGFPQRTPLNARITGTLQRDGYSVEKLIYESQPHF